MAIRGRKFSAVDLFAGGGGLTVGLKAAGFKVKAAVEAETSAQQTYATNHPEVRLYNDVRTVSALKLLEHCGGRINLLAACPPCQGFCTLTRRTTPDPQNELVLDVARLVEETLPDCVMLENVPGLSQGKGNDLFRELVGRLTAAGYKVNYAVLQVADYGVPQKRRRLVLLAGRGFEINLPEPSHARSSDGRLPPWRTVKDAFTERQLDQITPLTLSVATALGGAAKVNWHVVRDMGESNLKRLRAVKAGQPRASLPVELRPPCHKGSDLGFHNVYGRLSWDHPAVTITAGCTTLSKGRFGHPEEDRTISVMEAAALQTFPADYKFDTDYMEHVCKIIGNALPCVFAETVALKCADALVRQSHP